ncbi:uncharacterized protein A4U43_C10F12560, partial [Asparagus officinalis]
WRKNLASPSPLHLRSLEAGCQHEELILMSTSLTECFRESMYAIKLHLLSVMYS